MRLESAELYTVDMPLVAPFEASGHRTTMREALLLALHAEGATGWGEVVADPRPWYTGETLAGATHILREPLLPSVLGQDVPDLATLQHLTAWVKGNPMARAGVELAWWDLLGQQT